MSVNGKLDHDAEILDKIAVAVTDTKNDAGNHVVDFQTSERAIGSQNTFEWRRNTPPSSGGTAMARIRSIPRISCPSSETCHCSRRGTCRSEAHGPRRGVESHDFRTNFGIQDPFQFPITADYTYTCNEVRNGVACAVFGIDYEIFHPVTPPPGTTRMSPTRVAGASHQKYWWDLAGQQAAVYYEESFDFIFSFNTGDEVEFKGDAGAASSFPRRRWTARRLAGDIQKQLDAQKIPGVSVQPSDQGVTITLENVNFPPNSDQLLPAEQDKLRRIAEMLKKYPDRDISVAGFTARAPGYTEEDYQKLSEQRARAAAQFLLSQGARRADQVTARGMGAGSPIGGQFNRGRQEKESTSGDHDPGELNEDGRPRTDCRCDGTHNMPRNC